MTDYVIGFKSPWKSFYSPYWNALKQKIVELITYQNTNKFIILDIILKLKNVDIEDIIPLDLFFIFIFMNHWIMLFVSLQSSIIIFFLVYISQKKNTWHSGTKNFNWFGFTTLYCIYILGKTKLIYFDLYMHICII